MIKISVVIDMNDINNDPTNNILFEDISDLKIKKKRRKNNYLKKVNESNNLYKKIIIEIPITKKKL